MVKKDGLKVRRGRGITLRGRRAELIDAREESKGRDRGVHLSEA